MPKQRAVWRWLLLGTTMMVGGAVMPTGSVETARADSCYFHAYASASVFLYFTENKNWCHPDTGSTTTTGGGPGTIDGSWHTSTAEWRNTVQTCPAVGWCSYYWFRASDTTWFSAGGSNHQGGY